MPAYSVLMKGGGFKNTHALNYANSGPTKQLMLIGRSKEKKNKFCAKTSKTKVAKQTEGSRESSIFFFMFVFGGKSHFLLTKH